MLVRYEKDDQISYTQCLIHSFSCVMCHKVMCISSYSIYLRFYFFQHAKLKDLKRKIEKSLHTNVSVFSWFMQFPASHICHFISSPYFVVLSNTFFLIVLFLLLKYVYHNRPIMRILQITQRMLLPDSLLSCTHLSLMHLMNIRSLLSQNMGLHLCYYSRNALYLTNS